MSIEVLFELRLEVRRLFVAGSGMAAGDLRLQRIMPQLLKLGESAPIFKRMAQAVSEILEADASGSSSKLLELGSLLNSVLYTQGKTETKEALLPVEGTKLQLSTVLPYRKLQPVIEALTTRGQGRLEVLRQAYEDRLFLDFRVIPVAVQALDDPFTEIAELLHRSIIPAFGQEALPALRHQLQLGGGKADARRLELIHNLLPSSSMELLLQAAKEGSVEVRAAATQLLGHYPAQEDYVLELADDKRKEVRQAALFALSKLGTKQAVGRLYRALTSKDREMAIVPIQQCSAADLTRLILDNAETSLEQILQKTNVEPAVQQLLADVYCLDEKGEAEVLALYKKLLSTPEFILIETEPVQDAVAKQLLWMRTEEADQFLLGLQHTFKGKFIAYSFQAALRNQTPKEVYERFSASVSGNRQQMLGVFQRNTRSLSQSLYRESIDSDSDSSADATGLDREWDPRWVHVFAEIDDEEMVCRLADRPDATIAAYLVAKCQAAPVFSKTRTVHVLLALFRIGYIGAPELLINIVESVGKKQLYYLDRAQLTLLSLLPRTYSDRLRDFAESLPHENVKKQVLEIAEEVSHKPEQADQEEKGLGLWGWIRNKMS